LHLPYLLLSNSNTHANEGSLKKIVISVC